MTLSIDFWDEMLTYSIHEKACKLFLTALLILLYSNSHAITHDELTLNGMSSNWVLNNELYVGALYLENKADTTEAIMSLSGRKRMEFRITTDKWRERNFKKTWARSISINVDDATQKKYSNEIIRFSGMLKGPLIYGDKVTIDYTPRKHTRVFINDIQVFYTSKSDFFHAILSAWIGPRPPSSDFKKHIIKLDESNLDVQDAMGRYDYIRPDLENQRKKEIQRWVKPVKATAPKPAPVATPAPQPETAPQAKPQTAAPAPTPKPAPAIEPAPAATPTPKPAPAVAAPTPTPTPAPASPEPTTLTETVTVQPEPVAETPPPKTVTTSPAKPRPSMTGSSSFDSLLDEMEAETVE